MDIFERIVELKKSNNIFAVVSVVKTSGSTPGNVGDKMLVFPDGTTEGTVGGGAVEKQIITDTLNLLKNKKSELKIYELTKDLGMRCGGQMAVFIEVFLGDTPHLFIFGAGHIARKLGPMAYLAGISYTVVDDREEFAKKEFFKDATEVICSDFKRAFKKINVTENSYLVIVTYKHLNDEVCLQNALKTDACYIGMIGSKKKVVEIFENLSKKGLDIKNDKRVYAPVGLDIGDGTPGEIAVSILAEILKLKSGKTGEHLKIKTY